METELTLQALYRGLVIKEVQARLQASGVRAEGRIVSESVKAALAG